MSEISEHLKLEIVRHSMESEEEARQKKSELASSAGSACPHCKGRGGVDTSEDCLPCGECGGIGRRHDHEEGDSGYCVHCKLWVRCDPETGNLLPTPNTRIT
jgi:DnaJ-class molecular chaperone